MHHNLTKLLLLKIVRVSWEKEGMYVNTTITTTTTITTITTTTTTTNTNTITKNSPRVVGEGGYVCYMVICDIKYSY